MALESEEKAISVSPHLENLKKLEKRQPDYADCLQMNDLPVFRGQYPELFQEEKHV